MSKAKFLLDIVQSEPAHFQRVRGNALQSSAIAAAVAERMKANPDQKKIDVALSKAKKLEVAKRDPNYGLLQGVVDPLKKRAGVASAKSEKRKVARGLLLAKRGPAKQNSSTRTLNEASKPHARNQGR